jgi:hypothetical protein
MQTKSNTGVTLFLQKLTPKEPTVPTATNRFWAASHDLRFFETFFPNASWNKLRVSTNFMILGATDQKLWVFEVFK